MSDEFRIVGDYKFNKKKLELLERSEDKSKWVYISQLRDISGVRFDYYSDKLGHYGEILYAKKIKANVSKNCVVINVNLLDRIICHLHTVRKKKILSKDFLSWYCLYFETKIELKIPKEITSIAHAKTNLTDGDKLDKIISLLEKLVDKI